MAGKLVAGNWKMNGTGPDLAAVTRFLATVEGTAPDDRRILICPPATLLHRMAALADGRIALGGQDCHAAAAGAHTGDISAPMLAEAGASHVLLGHSERRSDHGETDSDVAAKADAALAAGLIPVICLGETAAHRTAGRTLETVAGQLAGSLPATARPDRLVIAYEPVWAIGSGSIPTGAEITEVHALLRGHLATRFGASGAAQVPLLYGGSVKPDNAAQIFALANVDGALVGGASLDPTAFAAIVAALDAA